MNSGQTTQAPDIMRLEQAIREGGIDTVVCALPDIWGRLVGKRLTAKYFLDALRGGKGFASSVYLFVTDMDMDPRPGYRLTGWEKGFQDFALRPDPSTFRILPWHQRTAFCLCDAVTAQGEDLPIAPRNILKRQIDRAAKLGIGFKCATELEFFTFRNSFEDAWDRRYRDLTPTSRYRADYHVLQSSLDEPFLQCLRDHMEAVGIEVENAKTEWGLGQQEIALKYCDPLEMADRHALYKTWVKEILGQQGYSATFMAKPFIDEVGSSCHVHISMWDKDSGAPAGHDPARPGGMSERFGAFVAGMIAGGAEYCWLSAPTINSYKRYRKDSFAPVQLVVGNDNRTCGFRLVGEGANFRVENRIPGADANPYLALAGVIASGLDGVESGMATPEIYDDNAYLNPALPRVPVTMGESIRKFAAAETVRASVGDQVHQHLVNFAGQELDAFEQETVTDWELTRYFERI